MGKNHQQVRFGVSHNAGLDLCLLLFKMSSDKARKQIPVAIQNFILGLER